MSDQENRHYSGLFCITCLKVFDEDSKGSFKCPNCKAEVGILR